MAWHRSVSAVLLLTIAIPTAKAQRVGSAPAGAPGLCTVGDGIAQRHSAVRPTRARRRREDSDHDAFSAGTIELAGEYLRAGAESRSPSLEARVEWGRFYEHCDSVIRQFAATFRGRGVDVDDCTQDVWVDLMRNLPDFKMDATRGQFTSWLYSIVRNKATDILRRQPRKSATSLSPDVMANLTAPHSDPAERAELKSDREALQNAMTKLRAVASESSYRVLHLRCIDGWRVQQVADALGLSHEQIWVREHRMKRKLRELLSPQFEASPIADESLTSRRLDVA